MTKLIADSGGTSTSWCLIAADGQRQERESAGLNPHHGLPTAQELKDCFLHERDWPQHIDAVHFYGAGCTPDRIGAVRALLVAATGCPEERVEVRSDVVGAARALCGDEPGRVCILGTGSNTSYWDGHDALAGVRPLGYVLGDEGSGAHIGRILLRGILRGTCSQGLADAFRRETGLSYADILERVYRQAQGNAFLASLATFCGRHRDDPYVRRVLAQSFGAFADEQVAPLVATYGRGPLHCVGSVAYFFRPELTAVLSERGLTVGNIVRRPIEALADYHERRDTCR